MPLLSQPVRTRSCWGASATLPALLLLGACQRDRAPLGADEPAGLPVAHPSPAEPNRRPPAMVSGRAVTWEELTPLLSEASGGIVLEEIALSRQVERELAARGLRVGDAEIAEERRHLAESIARATGSAADDTERLIQGVRRSRGLGDRRFAELLRRNAMLRRLVADEVSISEDDLRQAHAMRYGPRLRARLIVSPTRQQAAEALRRVLPAEQGGAGEPFAEVAATESTDPSRFRGGLLEPISAVDPTYPAAVRQTLSGMTPGQISPPIAIEEGFAIVRLEGIEERTGPPLASVRQELEAETRLVRERVLMDRLAARLVATAPVTIFDDPLEWGWRNRGAVAERP